MTTLIAADTHTHTHTYRILYTHAYCCERTIRNSCHRFIFTIIVIIIFLARVRRNYSSLSVHRNRVEHELWAHRGSCILHLYTRVIGRYIMHVRRVLHRLRYTHAHGLNKMHARTNVLATDSDSACMLFTCVERFL